MITLFSIVLFASIAAVGCDVLNSDSDLGSSEVQMQVQPANSSTAGQFMAGQQLMDYEIRAVKLFVEEIELESVSNNSSDFEDENFIVNLPLDGSIVNISKRNIQPGLYDEFDFGVL